MLQDPLYVRLMAQEGMSVPTYAYANNNPLHYIDRDGRQSIAVPGAGDVPWPLAPVAIPIACTFNFDHPLCRAIRPAGGPGTPSENERICKMGAAAAAAVKSLSNSWLEYVEAYNECIDGGFSMSVCVDYAKRRFRSCMGGLPQPPVPTPN